MKKILALLTAMMLLLSACSSATVDGAGKELEDAITNVTDADNKYVQMVKGGYRSDDPDTTYEDAFTAFFGAPRWKYFESDDGQNIVEFTGDCTYRDSPVKARIQFVVDEEGGTFEATYLAFNEVPQDILTLSAVISKAFEEAETPTGSTTKATDTPEKTTDTPAKGPATLDDAKEIFEEWETTHPLDPNLRINGGYDDVDNGVIRLFLYDYEYDYEYGAIEVDKRDGSMKMVSDFIEYDLDDWYNGDTSEGVNVEPEYNTYLNLDVSLVGRWRSYDGGMLEFTDDGIISSCDFQCWSMVGDNPDRIYWEASNGRVTCSSYFDRQDVTYVISEQSDGNEYIILSNNSDHKYERVTGENGSGIVGQWNSTYGDFWSYQFNADGTGMYNGSYPLTWYAYTTDNGSSAVSYSLLDSTYFDYSVSGNMLTVFLSDSSRVYTKVGS